MGEKDKVRLVQSLYRSFSSDSRSLDGITPLTGSPELVPDLRLYHLWAADWFTQTRRAIMVRHASPAASCGSAACWGLLALEIDITAHAPHFPP